MPANAAISYQSIEKLRVELSSKLRLKVVSNRIRPPDTQVWLTPDIHGVLTNLSAKILGHLGRLRLGRAGASDSPSRSLPALVRGPYYPGKYQTTTVQSSPVPTITPEMGAAGLNFKVSGYTSGISILLVPGWLPSPRRSPQSLCGTHLPAARRPYMLTRGLTRRT